MSKLKLFILSISLILFSFVFMLIPIKANPVLSASPSNIFLVPIKKLLLHILVHLVTIVIGLDCLKQMQARGSISHINI